MRTFLALDLNNEIKKTLSVLVDNLRRVGGNIKWVRKQGMHITLKFLGEIERAKISEINTVLGKVSRDYRPFSLKIKGCGHFPHEKNPRVLWTGVEAEESLYSLHKQLEKELEKIGFPPEKRTFRPHLTLGRVKTATFIKETIRELREHEEEVFGEMIVDKITFFESILKPTGAEYIVLSEYHLK